MGAGVVLDTSYLITLADPGRPNHIVARRYWQCFMEQGLPVYLSTIVVSEFCVRQEIPAEILRSCVVLPFNWDDAMKAAELDFTQLRTPGDFRVAVKDDVKIIAQAVVCNAQHVISEDSDTFLRMVADLRTAGKADVKTICLKDGFDRAFLDANGQRDFNDALNRADDATP